MSRLDIFINRMVSQRACLDFAVAETGGMMGPVFELGLGNGRTFDHMREKMPDRQIYVFERKVESNPASTPESDMVILGDVRETLPKSLLRFGATASLIHTDLGGHNLEKNDIFAREISPLIEPLVAVHGLIISSDRMYFNSLTLLRNPPGAIDGRCFIYRREA
ncbi:class I SAM-dependent methyltransferase [Pseudopelagicola sp. nBUS_19]|uniref:class I SAM-dependent methyltransferase n=1 Tax=unclassified Pseudopelagicola TaxID=2649563 RepID=UPI003EBC48FF